MSGGVEEREACAVGRLLAAFEQRRVEGAAELVGGQVVAAHVAHGRRRGDAVEDPLHHRPDALLDRSAPLPWGDRAGGAGEVEQVGALGVVEPQRVGERLEDDVGGAGGVAALQALVVLDADPGQRGDLLAPQPRHTTLAVGRQAGLLGRDLGAS